ncbi:hypothetical protein DITRI_Ditri09bG0157800 [Diplodiscus trichospermus]
MAAALMVYGVPVISFAGGAFCVPYPVELIIKKRRHGFSNISYEVSDVNGNLFLQKTLGNELNKSLLTLFFLLIFDKAITGEKWIVHRGESSETSQLLSTVQRSRFLPMKTRLDVFLPGSIDEDISHFQIVGSSHPLCLIEFIRGIPLLQR